MNFEIQSANILRVIQNAQLLHLAIYKNILLVWKKELSIQKEKLH